MDQPRDPPAPFINHDAGNCVRQYRRHSPVSDPPAAGTPGTPRRSYGYAFPTCGGSPAPSWIRGCGVRYATRQGSSAASSGGCLHGRPSVGHECVPLILGSRGTGSKRAVALGPGDG